MRSAELRVDLDLSVEGARIPPIHEGRYEVDLTTAGIAPPPPEVVAAVQRAGVKVLRVGVGCWLPSKDPAPEDIPAREWFLGTTMADVDNDDCYRWDHLDRNIDACIAFDCDVLLAVDYMPASLARSSEGFTLPAEIAAAIPPDYKFPDGVRTAPPAQPEVFAAAARRLVDHVVERGATLRGVELWNEPDLPIFYTGTYEEWFAMYRAFAPVISAAGHRVGGPSWAGLLQPELWLYQFMSDVAREGLPLDFYSFHRYGRTVEKVLSTCREVRAALDAAGLSATEAWIDEWGWALDDAPFFGTVGNAAFVAACMTGMPAAGITLQTNILVVDPLPPEFGRLHGIVRQDGDPNPVYWVVDAFRRLSETSRQVAATVDADGASVLAGLSEEGTSLVALLSNPTDAQVTVRLQASDIAVASPAVEVLTQEGFDRSGGWLPPVPAEVLDQAIVVTLAPWSVARVSADVA